MLFAFASSLLFAVATGFFVYNLLFILHKPLLKKPIPPPDANAVDVAILTASPTAIEFATFDK